MQLYIYSDKFVPKKRRHILLIVIASKRFVRGWCTACYIFFFYIHQRVCASFFYPLSVHCPQSSEWLLCWCCSACLACCVLMKHNFCVPGTTTIVLFGRYLSSVSLPACMSSGERIHLLPLGISVCTAHTHAVCFVLYATTITYCATPTTVTA